MYYSPFYAIGCIKNRLIMIRTIADIAKIAGVSKSTVSRALNDNPSISDKTKKIINRLARSHNFETHQGARNLSLKRSNTIAFIIPRDYCSRSAINDPFLIEQLQGITAAVSEYGYDLLIAQAGEDMPGFAVKYLKSKRADGLIVIGCRKFLDNILDHADVDSPIVVWGRGNNLFGSVDSDNLEGGRLAASHLIRTGCRNIVFLGGMKGEPEVVLRLKGYKKALNDAGLAIRQDYIIYGDYSKESGHDLVGEFIKKGNEIDGIFSCSDVMAIGAMNAARESGRIIPDEISVIGFDNIFISEYCNPPLTTVRQSIFHSGERLVHSLFRLMRDGVKSDEILPVELVVRGSTRSLNK